MVSRIVTHLIGSGSGVRPGTDKLIGTQNIVSILGIEYPDLSWAVSDPKLLVVDGQHAVGAGGVIVASEARVCRVDELCDAVIRWIDDVDRLVAAVSQE